MTPEQLWPQLRDFWHERGFRSSIDNAQAGVMETDWAENRAKIPQDIMRSTLGSCSTRLYSTGERDRFRTRVERTPGGSEIYISHRGMEEVYSTARKDQTVWQPRARPTRSSRPSSCARLMVKLGAKEEVARTLVAATGAAAPARARVLAVGGRRRAAGRRRLRPRLAPRRPGAGPHRLHRRRPRPQRGGLYFVRYVDPKPAAERTSPASSASCSAWRQATAAQRRSATASR